MPATVAKPQNVMEIICKNEQDNLVDLKSENDIVVTLKKIEK